MHDGFRMSSTCNRVIHFDSSYCRWCHLATDGVSLALPGRSRAKIGIGGAASPGDRPQLEYHHHHRRRHLLFHTCSTVVFEMSQARETYREPYKIDAGPLGWLEGLTVHHKATSKALVHYFGGVPYALPPVGSYRFRQARSLPHLYRYGTNASPGRFSNTAAVCPQPKFLGEQDKSLWDENCLQLNIYIPAKTPPQNGFPVFFYIHGTRDAR